MSRHLPNWLESYLAYTGESESPEEYHLWVGISVIAGALRRQVFFDMSYFHLYPNMYIVLVGPPGRCKKSTAMRIGKQMLNPLPNIYMTSDSTTREKLINDMSQSIKDGQSAMTAHSSEFASLLTSSQMDMVVFLTDIFDSPTEWVHKTISKGTSKITAPCLNLLAATTPDWISKAMPLDTIGIGLTSRVIFVYADQPRIKPPFPKLSDAQKTLGTLLIEDMRQINTIQGEFFFDDLARKEYEDWYVQRVENPNPTGDPRLNGYFERKPMHLIKIAMIVSAAVKDDRIITLDDLQAAMILSERIERRMPKVFASVGKNVLFADQNSIFETIAIQPAGLKIGQLMQMYGHSITKEELHIIIDTLVMMGMVAYDGKVVKPVLLLP